MTTTANPEPSGPRRLLIVSATMGEGHNATGRALRTAAARVWPDVEVGWLDVLDAMGRGTGPAFRWIYRVAVERLPWLYEFFYAWVWHHRWFARAAKRVIGAWSGRALAPHIDGARPDIVLSTYPMGSTGLEWLRRHRGLAVPTAAWISDFAPHPSWVHRDVDLNLVLHDVAVAPARESVPGASVGVSAPPVGDAFRPGDRSRARRRLDLPDHGFVVAVSSGSLAFGRGDEAVREILAGAPDAHVVVVTGRNDGLRTRLERAFGDRPRVRVLGWVEDMATLFTAADVVVSNAGAPPRSRRSRAAGPWSSTGRSPDTAAPTRSSWPTPGSPRCAPCRANSRARSASTPRTRPGSGRGKTRRSHSPAGGGSRMSCAPSPEPAHRLALGRSPRRMPCSCTRVPRRCRNTWARCWSTRRARH
ncbi:hypothetical protein ACFSVJ_02220 [Prauserella oleivorans]